MPWFRRTFVVNDEHWRNKLLLRIQVYGEWKRSERMTDFIVAKNAALSHNRFTLANPCRRTAGSDYINRTSNAVITSGRNNAF